MAFTGLCSLGIAHLEVSGQGRRGRARLLRSPASPTPQGPRGSSACGQSHGSGLLNIPQCSYCTASSSKYKTGPDMSPSTLSGCPRRPRRGRQGPGLLASCPPPSPCGLHSSCAGLARGCVRDFCLSLSQQRTPRPSPGPGDQSRAHSGKSPLGLGLALSPAAPPPGMPVRLRVQRRPRAGPVGAPGATRASPFAPYSLFIPSFLFH